MHLNAACKPLQAASVHAKQHTHTPYARHSNARHSNAPHRQDEFTMLMPNQETALLPVPSLCHTKLTLFMTRPTMQLGAEQSVNCRLQAAYSCNHI